MNDTGPDIAAEQINYAAVQQYFEVITTETAASASYMAHAQNLPPDSVRYRLRGEVATITDWLAEMAADGKVLDLGCGAGTWTEIFARRCGTVIGVEQSASMVRSARARLAGRARVEIQQGDVRAQLPEGPFDLIFLGGLCMYLNDVDVIALLRSLRARLETGGSVILRESTIPKGEHRLPRRVPGGVSQCGCLPELVPNGRFFLPGRASEPRLHRHGSRSRVRGTPPPHTALLARGVSCPRCPDLVGVAVRGPSHLSAGAAVGVCNRAYVASLAKPLFSPPGVDHNASVPSREPYTAVRHTTRQAKAGPAGTACRHDADAASAACIYDRH